MINLPIRFFLILALLTQSSFSLNIFHNDDESGNNIRDRIHNHTLVHSGESPIVNPEVKTAAKAAACASLGKGVCLGVQGAKYVDKKLSESYSK